MKAAQRFSQAHVGKVLDSSGCERVAAGFVARVGLLLDDGDRVPVTGEPVRSSSARWPPADDEDIVVGRRFSHAVLLAGGRASAGFGTDR